MSVKGIIMFLGRNNTRLERKVLIILDFENGFLPTYLPQCNDQSCFINDKYSLKTWTQFSKLLFQAPSTAISWSVYEFFKHYLNTDRNEGGSGSRQDPEDTYETLSVMKSVTATGQIGSRVGHLSPGATAQGSNEDHIPSVAVPITSRLWKCKSC